MLSTSTKTSTFAGFKNAIRTEEDFAQARDHIAGVLKDQFSLNLRPARLSNVVAKICGYSSTQALASTFDTNGEFPFEEIRDTGDADGNYFDTLEEALAMVKKLGLPLKESHVWSVYEGENGITYGPSQHTFNLLGYTVTCEPHDGKTYYYDEFDDYGYEPDAKARELSSTQDDVLFQVSLLQIEKIPMANLKVVFVI